MEGDYKNWKRQLYKIGEHGQKVKIRDQDWIELLGEKLVFAPREGSEFEDYFENFSLYLAQGRVDYISSEIDWDRLVTLYEKDKHSRQLMVYRPDWFWTDYNNEQWSHLNCVVAYQFLVRPPQLRLYVFMRSSDWYNAFPYDWYAASKHLEIFAKKIGEESMKRVLIFLPTNIHIRDQDRKKASKLVKGK